VVVAVFVKFVMDSILKLTFVCYDTLIWFLCHSAFTSSMRTYLPAFSIQWLVICLVSCHVFLDPEGGSQKATLVVVVVVVVNSSVKFPKAFFVRSRAQGNFAYTFMLTFPTDLLSQIFKLISN